MKRQIAARPVLAFVALTYGVSYLLGFPLLIAVPAWLPALPPPLGIYLARLGVVWGPAVAALVVCAATPGRGGPRALLHRLRPRRSDLPWLTLPPVLATAAAAAAYLLAGVPAGRLGSALAAGWPLLAAHLVLQTLVIGVGEELGWRGWLLPTLLRRQRRIVATAAVGVVWGTWHLPILLADPARAPAFVGVALALSVLLTALWSRTGERVAAVALAHGSFNAPFFFLEGALGGEATRHALDVVMLLFALAAALLVATRWRWWMGRHPDRDTGTQPAAPVPADTLPALPVA